MRHANIRKSFINIISVDVYHTIRRIVNHEHRYKADYATISEVGVTRMRSDDETEFIPLDRWEIEMKNFYKLRKVHQLAMTCLF